MQAPELRVAEISREDPVQQVSEVLQLVSDILQLDPSSPEGVEALLSVKLGRTAELEELYPDGSYEADGNILLRSAIPSGVFDQVEFAGYRNYWRRVELHVRDDAGLAFPNCRETLQNAEIGSTFPEFAERPPSPAWIVSAGIISSGVPVTYWFHCDPFECDWFGSESKLVEVWVDWQFRISP